MILRLVPLSLALIAAPAVGHAPVQAAQIDVTMRNFEFAPDTIRLVAHRNYVLHLSSEGGHSFAAPAFFAAATIAPADRGKIDRGRIELDGGEAVDIHFAAPGPGEYEIHCTHFLHATRGMKGRFIVS